MFIPNSLASLFAPDTPALKWESDECFQALGSSFTRRSKNLRAVCWRRVWKTGKLTLPRFGQICEPSHGKALLEKWMSSVVATPVKVSVSPANGKAKTTPAISGPTYRGQLQLFALDSASLRTSPDTLPSGLKTSCGTWASWVTRLRRDCLQRLKSARLTSGSGCSSWPSPRAGEGQQTNEHGDNWVRAAFKQQKTRHDRTGKEITAKSTFDVTLTAAVRGVERNWPTASSLDWKDTQGMAMGTMTSGKFRDRRDQLARMVYASGPPAPASRSGDGNRPGRLWATPNTAQEGSPTRPSQVNKPTCGGRLEVQAAQWATPRTITGGAESAERKQELGRTESGGGDLQADVKGKLNPMWVCALMGIPIGWVTPSCADPVTAGSMSYEC